MATLRRRRMDRSRQQSHSPVRSLDIENNYDYKINRYQKANWGDIEAKEAHASVVKYMWRKEYELNKKIDKLKKQVSKQLIINSDENSGSELEKVEICSNEPEKRLLTKREIDAPIRGIHFRTTEDKTAQKLNLIKSERKIDDNNLYIEKVRSRANNDIEDDISEDLKNVIRGRSAYQISKALLADSGRSAREAKRRRELEKLQNEQHKQCIYDIMAKRNEIGITHNDNEQHESLSKRILHRDHDYRWESCDYLNLVGFRMQNNSDTGFRLQNHGEIVWGPKVIKLRK